MNKKTANKEIREAPTARISKAPKNKADNVFIELAVQKNFLFTNLNTEIRDMVIGKMKLL